MVVCLGGIKDILVDGYFHGAYDIKSPTVAS
jgi:hypothetical protein